MRKVAEDRTHYKGERGAISQLEREETAIDKSLFSAGRRGPAG